MVVQRWPIGRVSYQTGKREELLSIIMPWRLRQMAHELIEVAFGKIKGEVALDAMQAEPGLSIRSRYPEDLDASGWATPRPS